MSMTRRIAVVGLAGVGLVVVALLVFSGTGPSGLKTTLAQPEEDNGGGAAQQTSQAQVGNGDGTINPAAVAAQEPLSVGMAPAEVFQGKMDHAAAGTGTRNAGYGNIRLRGVPKNSAVVKAFLYWGMICSGTSCPATQTVSFDERKFTGKLIGTGPTPCWPGSILGAYRADVTSRMPPDINGDYEVTGLASNVIDGSDSWSAAGVVPMSEGATLLVIYSNNSLPVSVTYLHHGAVGIWPSVTISNALAPALPGTALKFTRFGADGQVGTSTGATPGVSDEGTFIGPTPGPLVQIAGNGSAFNQNSDWNGEDGGPLNQLWDTRTSTVNGTIPVGVASYDVMYSTFGDCVDVIGHVLTAR